MFRGLIIIAVGAILVAPGWSGLLLDPWATRLGWFGTFLIISGSYVQYRLSKPVKMEFEAVDWIKYSEEGYELIVPDKVHGKGPDCQIQTFGRNEEGFEVVMCDEHHNKIRSAVVLQAVTRFGGKIVIT